MGLDVPYLGRYILMIRHVSDVLAVCISHGQENLSY